MLPGAGTTFVTAREPTVYITVPTLRGDNDPSPARNRLPVTAARPPGGRSGRRQDVHVDGSLEGVRELDEDLRQSLRLVHLTLPFRPVRAGRLRGADATVSARLHHLAPG